MPRFNKNEWINYGRWVQPVLSGCFWSPWNTVKSVKTTFSNVRFNSMLFLDGNSLTKMTDKEAMKNAIKEMDNNNHIKEFIKKS
ncbi:MAG: hypothetical protein HY393_03775 [Candidatus Diapherotrites archaeon]|nr:hypothetical protein [Candidatus Diapherotrites archaeon]